MMVGISAVVVIVVGALATVALLRAFRDEPPSPPEPTAAGATLAPDTQLPSEAPESAPAL